MEIFIWSFLAATYLLWLAAWSVFLRFRTVPPADLQGPPSAWKLSVVIPARNEEENLARLLPSLADPSFPLHEVIVVDDHSTDRTAGVARELGFPVLSGAPLPAGWCGKPWACQQGADAATGDWILFLDADTVVEAGGLRRLAALARNHPGAVHSICPHHRIESLHEELSAFFNAVMVLGMNAFTWRGEGVSRIGLFGQALLISSSNYAAVEGHRRVRGQVLENFHLSEHFREAGIPCRSYLGEGTLSMCMFPSGLDGLVAGWSKGFVAGAGRTPRATLVGISAWLSALIMATIALSFFPLANPAQSLVIIVLYLLGAVQCLYVFRRVGTFSGFNAMLFPVGLVFYQVVFFRALWLKRRGGTFSWKGRDVS